MGSPHDINNTVSWANHMLEDFFTATVIFPQLVSVSSAVDSSQLVVLSRKEFGW